MKLDRVADYPAVRAAYRQTLPTTFNFACDVVDAWAADPDHQALIWADAAGDERRFSYADIGAWSSRVARLLGDAGLERGDRVIVMLPRIPEWQVAITAAMRIGAVPIPCITMLTADDLAYRCEDAEAAAVITTSAEAGKFANIDGPAIRIVVDADAPDGWRSITAADALSDEPFGVALSPHEPAILYYTSGSTGGPKAVLHSAAAIYLWRISAEYWLSLDPDDVMWCTADTGWSKAGTSILFGPWSRGATVFFYDGPFEPERRLELLERYSVTCFCAAATELRRLILVDAGRFDLGALQLTVSAGESVNPEVVERWSELVGTPLLDGYGQTETLMTVTNMPGMEVRPGSMGRPLPGVDVGVLTADGSVERSGAGQLVIRAPNDQLMIGYRGEPARTDACYLDLADARWFLTGDNVEIDDDGYVYYTGRADDIINSAGYRIGPQEVENALTRHPAVQECAVVGAPDSARGEVVVAFVVARPGTNATPQLVGELQDHVKATTAPYKYPRRIEFVDELPKTVSGKIRRNVLRQLLRDAPRPSAPDA